MVRLTSTELLGALQWHLDYSATPGDILGDGTAPQCEVVAPALSALNLIPGVGYLNAGFISLEGFQGPLDILRCQYRGISRPSPSDFKLTVLDATDIDDNDLMPATRLEVVVE